MTKQEFAALCQSPLLLDGAMGTQLQDEGLPLDACPEQWLMEHRSVLRDIQGAYSEAGSRVLYTPTFGGNRIKLTNYGLGDQVEHINRTLASWTKEHAPNALIAGNLSSTGLQVFPFGPASFDEAVEVYKEQVRGLLAGDVDLFAIETMADIQEARAAVLAVKETCDLPILVTMTYDERGRTLTGSDPVSALVILQSLGVDAVGLNCSTGPEAMVSLLEQMARHAQVPLVAKPNAGLPKWIDGKTVFDMDPSTFAAAALPLYEAGAQVLGGCCGTNPDHIRALAGVLPKETRSRPRALGGKLASVGCTLDFHAAQQTLVVGERINPTGKRKLQEELARGSMALVRQYGKEQIQAGAAVLDVNVSLGDGKEAETMVKAVATLVSLNAPLALDSSDPTVIEQALRIYPGRALVNSVPWETGKSEKLFEICAHYGAAVLLLPVSDTGVPKSLEERKSNILALVHAAQEHGIAPEDCIVDALAMTVSANPEDAKRTLDTIAWCRDTLSCATILGLSNVSFGLPGRPAVNGAFLAMAIQHGLDVVIANPSAPGLMEAKVAADLLSGRDPEGRVYLGWHRERNREDNQGAPSVSTGAGDARLQARNRLTAVILEGQKEEAAAAVGAMLDTGMAPDDILNQVLMPAITAVGNFFDDGTYFLPQLIASAETMELAVAALQPHLLKQGGAGQAQGTIVMATVKGDVHDIGKNLVSLLLRNHGYHVIDLGKNVPAEEILAAVDREKADMVGLSALMTTTMPEMERVITLLREAGSAIPVIVGGAAVSSDFAQRIGANGYGKDASAAVRLAATLLQKNATKKP